MTINEAVAAIEAFLRDYDGGGVRPVSFQVRPSGDDVDVIKIYADLGLLKAPFRRTQGSDQVQPAALQGRSA